MLGVQIKAGLYGLISRALTATIILVVPFFQSSPVVSDTWSFVRQSLFLFCSPESEE